MEPTKLDTLKKLFALAGTRPLAEAELAELNVANGRDSYDALMGLRYTHVGPGDVRAEVEVGARHRQPWGVVHGGLYCAIAESVGSLAGVIAAGKPVMGVNNDTNFLRPVSAGIISAIAHPVQLGSRTQVWEIEISQDGQLKSKTTLRTMVAA